MKDLAIYGLLALCFWHEYDIAVLKIDVKKLTEDKYQITCKLGRPVRGVNNTVWDCVGDGR